MTRTSQVDWLAQRFIPKSLLCQSFKTFDDELNEAGLFFINKIKSGWSTLQSIKKLIIKFKRVVVCTLLVLKVLIKTQLKVVYQSISPSLLHFTYLFMYQIIQDLRRRGLPKQVSDTWPSHMAILYVCMQSDNLEKFIKLCVGSHIYVN